MQREKAKKEKLRYVTGHVMIWGESKEKTRILLMDNSSSFQKEETPLIRFLDDDFCNQAYFNGIRHITIEIGKNNPSAIAVDYVSSNNGELSDVDIICHDQQNPSLIGLNLPIRGGGLSFIHDIFIKGFKTGINVEGDYPGYTFENIRLEQQLNEGIRHISKNIVIHNLTSINKCSAIRCEGSDAITTLIDAELLGGNDSETAIENEGHLFLRNIKSDGYGNVLNDKGVTFSKSFLDEYSSNVIRLSESSPAKSLSLPIKDTPSYEFPSPHKWTIFDVSKQDDDTDALQSLIDSGAEYIFIKATDECLKLRGTVRLGKKLKWIHGGWCNMDVVNEGEPDTPLFLFEDGANDLIVFEAFSNGQYRNTFTTFLNVRSKATVIRDIFMGYGDSSYRNYGTGDLFLENVVTGGGDYGHLPESKEAGWLFENQSGMV